MRCAAILLTIALGCAAGPANAEPPLAPPPERADRIVVEKSAHRLLLMRGEQVLSEYPVALGFTPVGDKTREGDGRTPQGRYRIDYKNAMSAYHLSLHISYPDAADRRRADEHGVSPGGDIMIHGLPDRLAGLGSLHRLVDWTDGCIAVTNGEIEDIWKRVAVGTPIEIKE